MTATGQPRPAEGRRTRRQRATRAIGGLAAPIVTGVLVAVIVQHLQSHPRVLRLETPAQIQMTQGAALALYHVPAGDTPRADLLRWGVLLRVRLHAEGYAGRTLQASCHLYDETVNEPAGQLQDLAITVDSSPDADSPCWLPVKRGHTYRGVFQLDMPDAPPASPPVSVVVPRAK